MSIRKALVLGVSAAVISTSLIACGEKKDSKGGAGADGVAAKITGEITVISREESSGTRGAFDELMKITDGKTNMLFPEAVITSSTDEAASKVETDPNAIGYTSLGSVNDKVKAISIDGAAATEANVKAGTYTISRPFVLATMKNSNNRLADDFVRFAASRQGQEVVGARGYITIDATEDYTPPSGLSGKITLSGSTSVQRVVDRLKEEYVKLNPNVNIEITYIGSSAGIKDCTEGRSDIAMSSRALKDDEKARLNDVTFALDGIAVVVNSRNSIDNLTAEQVTKIFKGEIRNWEDL